MTLPSLIACPGCKHKLTLPDEVLGQRVQCPVCLLEFNAQPTPVPIMEVEPAAQPQVAEPAKKEPDPPLQAQPPLQTAYAPTLLATSRPTSASENLSIYCVLCGEKFARSETVCPSCGEPVGDEPRGRRRPRRTLQPVRGMLAIVGAILIPVGVAVLIGTMLTAAILFDRRPPRPGQLGMILSFVAVGVLIEVGALVLCLMWLYEAWRLVLRGDEEYSAGLMVGLLFVPFFNFYWMFRVIPGLSAAIQEEMKFLAPSRPHSAGWIPGLAACICLLIPYLQPIAICMFVAWMLIANNAVQRFARFHEESQNETR